MINCYIKKNNSAPGSCLCYLELCCCEIAVPINWIANKSPSVDLFGKQRLKGFSVGQLYAETPAEQGEQPSLSYEHKGAYSARFLIALIVNYFKGITAKTCHQESLLLAESETLKFSCMQYVIKGEMYFAKFHPFLSMTAVCNYIL